MPRARKITPPDHPQPDHAVDRISFTLSIGLNERARVEHHAKREDRSLSALIRRALTLYLDAADEEERKHGKGSTSRDGEKKDNRPEANWDENPFEKKS